MKKTIATILFVTIVTISFAQNDDTGPRSCLENYMSGEPAQGKKRISDSAKHRRTMIFYFLAILIILASIPWPFREIGAGRGWY